MRAYTVKDFALDEATLRVQETLFHNANGLVGVRGTLEEGVPRGWNTMKSLRSTVLGMMLMCRSTPQRRKNSATLGDGPMISVAFLATFLKYQCAPGFIIFCIRALGAT